MLRRISARFRQFPFMFTLVIASAVGILGVGVAGVWALKVQPDPQVIRKMEPLTNTGVDANGLTLAQWHDRGNSWESYRPVPKKTFYPGDVMWTLRQDCFVNKLATGWVFRSFLDGDRRDAKGDIDLSQQDGGQWILKAVPIPSRTDGCAVKNHPTEIPARLPAGKWTYSAGVDFYKNPMQTSVRIHFRPVVIEIVALPAPKATSPVGSQQSR